MATTMSTSPSSASNSNNSPLSHKPNIDNPAGCNNGSGVVDSQEMKPEIAKLENTDSKEDLERYRKLEDEYTRYLNAKYFSNKDIFGVMKKLL